MRTWPLALLALVVACNDSNGPPPAGTLHDRIVFLSGRGGSDELYEVNPDGTALRPILQGTGLTQQFPDVAPDGHQVAFSDQLGRVWIQSYPEGSLRRIGQSHVGSLHAPRWSPDGTRLVLWGAGGSLFTADVGTGTITPLLSDEYANIEPEWAMGGAAIVFATDRSGDIDLYLIDPDGQNLRRLTDHPGRENAPRTSPDGMRVSFGWSDQFYPGGYAAGARVLELTTGTDSLYESLVTCPCAWAPDGGSLVFFDGRDGESGLSVLDLASGVSRRITSSPAGLEWMPDWGPAGGELH